jgi:hypothetical protein
MELSICTGLLLFCIIYAAHQQQQQQQLLYTAADIDYRVPLCGIPNGQNLTNSIAQVTISNSAIGNIITLSFDFSAPSSCYLCEKNNLSCIDNNISTSVGFGISRAYDTILVILEPGTNRILTQSGRIRSTLETNSISFDLKRLLNSNQLLYSCQFRFNFILTTLINIGTALNPNLTELSRCFITSQQQQSDSIQCGSNRLYQAAGFNCVIYPTIYPIEYTTTNCLTPSIQSVSPNASAITNYSPLYWYNEFLWQNTHPINNMTLCDLPFPVVLYRSNLFLSQCYNRGALSAWYQLATLVVAHQMNRDPSYSLEMMQAIDLLERNCDKMDMSFANITNSSIMKTIQALIIVDADDDAYALCNSISLYFKNNTVFKDVTLLNRWYFEAFKSIRLPTQDTENIGMIILNCISITPFILLLIVILYHYKVKIKGVKKPVNLLQ